MNELDKAAELIISAVKTAEFYSSDTGGAYRTITDDGEIAVGVDEITPVENVQGLPGEWGTVYESIARNISAAHDIIESSGIPDSALMLKPLFQIMAHLPTPPAIESGDISTLFHTELPISATPGERMQWLLNSRRGIISEILIEILYRKESPKHEVMDSGALAPKEAGRLLFLYRNGDVTEETCIKDVSQRLKGPEHRTADGKKVYTGAVRALADELNRKKVDALERKAKAKRGNSSGNNYHEYKF